MRLLAGHPGCRGDTVDRFVSTSTAVAFVEYARGYELNIDEDRASEIKADWLQTWPEMREYFRYIARLVDAGRLSFCQCWN